MTDSWLCLSAIKLTHKSIAIHIPMHVKCTRDIAVL